MADLKISLITVTRNAGNTLNNCLASVIAQNYPNVEHIIIDGGSTDSTLQIIAQYKKHISISVSEPDNGIYDAMNKGIALATGQVIGMLNADDVFANNEVLHHVADAFTQHNADVVYGDLDYVNENNKVIRKWRSGAYSVNSFNWGWMPPHPTFYCRASLFKKYGNYSIANGTAADYDLILRFMFVNRVNTFYINKVMVKMKTGGASNQSIKSRFKAFYYDLKAMRVNAIFLPALTIILKPLRKFGQYL